MNRIEQQANTVIVTHNPDLETCAWDKCNEVLFGECVLASIREVNTQTKKEKTKDWLMCSPECYIAFDGWFEEIYMAWAGEDHVATIDNGMPDEWFDSIN